MKTLTATVLDELVAEALLPITLYTVIPSVDDPLYLAGYDRNVLFDGKMYRGYPISHETIKTGLDEIISHVSVSVSVVDREIIGAIQRNNGLRGALVTITTVFANMLDDPDNKIIAFEGLIASVTLNEAMATFDVTSKFDLQDVQLPRRLFRRQRCCWIYKDSNTCQYTGNLPTCDKALEGLNGCRAHDNVLRFGAFPAIPERKNGMV